VKAGVVESTEDWQTCQTPRNRAAHDNEIDYVVIAEHFNVLNEFVPMLCGTASNLLDCCAADLDIVLADSGLMHLFEIAVARRF